MRSSLRSLLDHPIDYAGLFPPAQYSMKVAVTEYLGVLASSDQWIVDRFVCHVDRLAELRKTIEGMKADTVRVTVIGSESTQESIEKIKSASEDGHILVEAYEVKVPQGTELTPIVRGLKKLPSQIGQDGIDVYLEVGWGEGMVDAIHDAASLFEDAGFKARTGGTEASAFPSVPDLAAFISEVSSLECPFKFTAGIHDPVRHYDEDLGVYRHGFLNVMLAAALATTQDLNRREIETVLEIDDPSKMHFGMDDIRVGEHWLEAEQIDAFWDVFGGFGSCSVEEPLDGLRRLGLLMAVGS